jgi:hypothetical protein
VQESTAQILQIANDPRVERYWCLLATINGWPAPPALAPVLSGSSSSPAPPEPLTPACAPTAPSSQTMASSSGHRPLGIDPTTEQASLERYPPAPNSDSPPPCQDPGKVACLIVEYLFYCRGRPGTEALAEALAEAHRSFMDRYGEQMIARDRP